MLWEIYGITTLCTFVANMARWARRYTNGEYNHTPAGDEMPDSVASFLGYAAVGLIAPLGMAYMIGAMKADHEQAAERKARELAAAEQRADRILMGHSDG